MEVWKSSMEGCDNSKRGPTFRFETRHNDEFLLLSTTPFTSPSTILQSHLCNTPAASCPSLQTIIKYPMIGKMGVIDAIKRVARPDIDGVQINVLRLTKIANTNTADPRRVRGSLEIRNPNRTERVTDQYSDNIIRLSLNAELKNGH